MFPDLWRVRTESDIHVHLYENHPDPNIRGLMHSGTAFEKALSHLVENELLERFSTEGDIRYQRLPVPPPGLTLTSLGGFCPVQGDGTLDGHPFYFRARGEHWTFSVADEPGSDPVAVGSGYHGVPGWIKTSAYGSAPYEAGWMPHDTAERLVLRAAAEYCQGTNGAGWQYYPAGNAAPPCPVSRALVEEVKALFAGSIVRVDVSEPTRE